MASGRIGRPVRRRQGVRLLEQNYIGPRGRNIRPAARASARLGNLRDSLAAAAYVDPPESDSYHDYHEHPEHHVTSFGLIASSQSRCLRAAAGGRGANLLHAPGLPAVRGDAARPGFTEVSVPTHRFRNSPFTIVDPSPRLAVHPESHHEKHEIYGKHERDRSLSCLSCLSPLPERRPTSRARSG